MSHDDRATPPYPITLYCTNRKGVTTMPSSSTL